MIFPPHFFISTFISMVSLAHYKIDYKSPLTLNPRCRRWVVYPHRVVSLLSYHTASLSSSSYTRRLSSYNKVFVSSSSSSSSSLSSSLYPRRCRRRCIHCRRHILRRRCITNIDNWLIVMYTRNLSKILSSDAQDIYSSFTCTLSRYRVTQAIITAHNQAP